MATAREAIKEGWKFTTKNGSVSVEVRRK